MKTTKIKVEFGLTLSFKHSYSSAKLFISEEIELGPSDKKEVVEKKALQRLESFVSQELSTYVAKVDKPRKQG